MRVLFWNTHKNENINQTLCDLVAENNISMIVLAEYTADSDELTKRMQENHGIKINKYYCGCERIHLFGVHKNIEPRSDNLYS